MIAEYESPEKPELYNTPRIYSLSLKHKHLPEMQKICGLDVPPVFCPIVDDYYKGMAVTVMLQNWSSMDMKVRRSSRRCLITSEKALPARRWRT